MRSTACGPFTTRLSLRSALAGRAAIPFFAFVAAACVSTSAAPEQPWEAVPCADHYGLAEAELAIQVDYVAVRSEQSDGRFSVLQERGKPCSTAVDRDACMAKLATVGASLFTPDTSDEWNQE